MRKIACSTNLHNSGADFEASVFVGDRVTNYVDYKYALVRRVEHVSRLILDTTIDAYADRFFGKRAMQNDFLHARRLRVMTHQQADVFAVPLELVDGVVVRQTSDVDAVHFENAVAHAQICDRGRTVGHYFRNENARLLDAKRMTRHIAAAHYAQTHGAVDFFY